MENKLLYVIPARAGSKGVKHKNRKLLGGKPLISYTLEAIKQVADKEHICVSTDDEQIVNIALKSGLEVPFMRPDTLSQDHSTSKEVLLHALDFYKAHKGIDYDGVVMLQPTSPFRRAEHIREAISLYSNRIDAVLSVFETKSNPYYVLMEEDDKGFLFKSKEAFFQRRQDCPTVYELNGAIYIINANSLRENEITQMKKLVKYQMDEVNSIDIDSETDFEYAEFLIASNKV